MQIRRRYSKTRMAAHRRDHLPHNVRFIKYAAFKVRMQYGRRPCTYRWHFKRKDLTIKALEKALANISGYSIVSSPTHIYLG